MQDSKTVVAHRETEAPVVSASVDFGTTYLQGNFGSKLAFERFANSLITDRNIANAWFDEVFSQRKGDNAIKTFFLGDGLRAHFAGSGNYYLNSAGWKVADKALFDQLNPENRQKLLREWGNAKASDPNFIRNNTKYLSGALKAFLGRAK